MIRVIVSLLYQLTRRLLSVPAVLLRRDTTKDAELLVLRHENAVLRRQITCQVRYEPADRLWFAALPSLLPPTPLTRDLPHPTHDNPGLAPQVHRCETGLQRAPTSQRTTTHSPDNHEARPSPGPRQPTLGPPENPQRTDPARAPDRRIHRLEDPELSRHRSRSTPNRSHLETVPGQPGPGIIATDFFHIDTALGKRLYALVFLEHGTRRLHIADATEHPTQEWTAQQARNLTAQFGTHIPIPASRPGWQVLHGIRCRLPSRKDGS